VAVLRQRSGDSKDCGILPAGRHDACGDRIYHRRQGRQQGYGCDAYVLCRKRIRQDKWNFSRHLWNNQTQGYGRVGKGIREDHVRCHVRERRDSADGWYAGDFRDIHHRGQGWTQRLLWRAGEQAVQDLSQRMQSHRRCADVRAGSGGRNSRCLWDIQLQRDIHAYTCGDTADHRHGHGNSGIWQTQRQKQSQKRHHIHTGTDSGHSRNGRRGCDMRDPGQQLDPGPGSICFHGSHLCVRSADESPHRKGRQMAGPDPRIPRFHQKRWIRQT